MLQTTDYCPFCPFINLSCPSQASFHSIICEDYKSFLEVYRENLIPAPLGFSPLCFKQEAEECTSTCKICFNNYDGSTYLPKILPNCGHTFCKKCLNSILNENIRLPCPVCRYVYKQSVDQLPTNLALLELTGKPAAVTEMCEKHSMKLMAYCEDDLVLLCGACILDHKTHNCKLLTDAALNFTAEGIRKKLMARQELLSATKLRLKSENIELCKRMREIEGEVLSQKRQIDQAKTNILDLFTTNLQKCLKEVRQCKDWDKFETVSMCYEFNIKLFTDDIQRVEEKLSRFDKLGIVEKLQSIKLNSVQKEFISVNEIAEKILEQKTREINYHESIKTGILVFENPLGS